ncbi:hypothetical protein KC19_5G044500 [Ceratodon purpureus]|uniref:Uncharacterized protein n=1 Tax=Ceratodon purpureus TaxID=3225 RepID=A0A8T0HXV5_CERPU|nr:hypothetical protein KC19_5G044500 [Ceratodon purpureus]
MPHRSDEGSLFLRSILPNCLPAKLKINFFLVAPLVYNWLFEFGSSPTDYSSSFPYFALSSMRGSPLKAGELTTNSRICIRLLLSGLFHQHNSYNQYLAQPFCDSSLHCLRSNRDKFPRLLSSFEDG